jgi:hypothetical protein
MVKDFSTSRSPDRDKVDALGGTLVTVLGFADGSDLEHRPALRVIDRLGVGR